MEQNLYQKQYSFTVQNMKVVVFYSSCIHCIENTIYLKKKNIHDMKTKAIKGLVPGLLVLIVALVGWADFLFISVGI